MKLLFAFNEYSHLKRFCCFTVFYWEIVLNLWLKVKFLHIFSWTISFTFISERVKVVDDGHIDMSVVFSSKLRKFTSALRNSRPCIYSPIGWIYTLDMDACAWVRVRVQPSMAAHKQSSWWPLRATATEKGFSQHLSPFRLLTISFSPVFFFFTHLPTLPFASCTQSAAYSFFFLSLLNVRFLPSLPWWAVTRVLLSIIHNSTHSIDMRSFFPLSNDLVSRFDHRQSVVCVNVMLYDHKRE